MLIDLKKKNVLQLHSAKKFKEEKFSLLKYQS